MGLGGKTRTKVNTTHEKKEENEIMR